MHQELVREKLESLGEELTRQLMDIGVMYIVR